MDIYFQTAAFILGGAIFALLAFYAAGEIEMANNMTRDMRRPTDVFAFDVATSERTFSVDRKAFIQFVLGQQSQHRVLLDHTNPSGWYNTSTKSGDKVRVDFDVVFTMHVGSLNNIVQTQTKEIVIKKQLEEDIQATWNMVEVTGVSGYRMDLVKAFYNQLSSKTVNITRYLNDDGTIVLVCREGS